MQHKYQSTDAYSSMALSIDIFDMMRAKADIFERLGNQLEMNKQLVKELLNFTQNQRTASASQGSSRSSDFQGSQNKSQSSESVIYVKNEEEIEEEQNQKIIDSERPAPKAHKNDTKNIPKNYGKAILGFIQKSSLSPKLAQQMGVKYSDLMIHVRRLKKKINSIKTLKKMWGSQNLDHKIKKCIRILSYHFMRKHCLQYIFHSKVRYFGTHIKYRKKLIEGIQNPTNFNHMKDY